MDSLNFVSFHMESTDDTRSFTRSVEDKSFKVATIGQYQCWRLPNSFVFLVAARLHKR